MCLKCQGLIKAIDAYLAKADDDLTEQLKAEGFAEPKQTVQYISNIEGQLEISFSAENDWIIEQAEQSLDLDAFAHDIWPGILDSDPLRVEVTRIFKEQLTDFMPQYVGYYLQRTDKELICSALSKRTTAWVGEWSETLGELMKLSSHKEIEGILQTGLANGDGVAEFARAIQDAGIRDPYWKARRAAITEVLRAHSVAQQEAMMQSPVVEDKIWRHTGSYRNDPRQNHVDMEGQRVRKDMPFTLAGADGGIYTPMYPRDGSLPAGESVNCHCYAEPVVNDAVFGFTLEERQAMQQAAIDEMDMSWEAELDAANKAKAGITEDGV